MISASLCPVRIRTNSPPAYPVAPIIPAFIILLILSLVMSFVPSAIILYFNIKDNRFLSAEDLRLHIRGISLTGFSYHCTKSIWRQEVFA